ncbi:hypothetical protein AYO20_09324 [Fonsecaea nubica]|uniref:NmrA-like domain-containing protein n=1 Tax=Fonsecaea nubica TaxID=856822 RepID=A0A178CHP1_9EURO|nr:hypothetical protein AYO20_09324 [Fonsecaea nubica]OAL28844.1 hypothetical protein AYO20_09324 [Fonsecaea nubica]
MVKVAIAGGTGGLGRMIVETLEASNEHTYIILTRTQSDQPRHVFIDYTSIDSISKALDAHDIHTLVSVLSIKSKEQSDAQLNLIRGAARTSCVKRFTPSEFGFPRKEKQYLESTSSDADYKLAAVMELDKTGLEYTLFSHGIFADYFGMPRIKSYLDPWVFAIDIAHSMAGIPGSGDVPTVYTYSGDVAKFVVGTLSLPDGTWSKSSVIMGDRKTLNQVLRIAEAVRGTRFTVEYDPVERLKRGHITELPSHRHYYSSEDSKRAFQQRFAGFGIAMESGGFDFTPSHGAMVANDAFPHIHPMSVEDVIRAGWQ